MKNFTKHASMLALIAGFSLQPSISSAQVAITGMKWYPGHYLLVKSNLSNTDTNQLLNDFNVAKVRGIQKTYYWSDLEVPKAGGGWKYDFSVIENDINLAKQKGKKISIMLGYKYMASATKSSLPQYILNLQPVTKMVDGMSIQIPAYYVQGKPSDGPYNSGNHANFGHPATLAAFNNLLSALAAKYDTNPNVAFLQFSESSIGADLGDNKEIAARLDKNFIDGVIAMDQKAADAFHHTPLIQSINYPRNRLPDFINTFTNKKMGFGGPDSFAGSFEKADNGLAFVANDGTKLGVYWYNVANNNKLPIGMQVHNENLEYDTNEERLASPPIPNGLTPAQAVNKIYNFAYSKLRSNFITWQVFGASDPNRNALEARLKNNTSPAVVVTTCPTIYSNTCQK